MINTAVPGLDAIGFHGQIGVLLRTKPEPETEKGKVRNGHIWSHFYTLLLGQMERITDKTGATTGPICGFDVLLWSHT